MVEPKTLRVLCLRCYEPDQAKRDELGRAVIRESLRRFRDEHDGRLPDSTDELVSWLDSNVDGEKGPLHLIGPKPDEEDAD